MHASLLPASTILVHPHVHVFWLENKMYSLMAEIPSPPSRFNQKFLDTSLTNGPKKKSVKNIKYAQLWCVVLLAVCDFWSHMIRDRKRSTQQCCSSEVPGCPWSCFKKWIRSFRGLWRAFGRTELEVVITPGSSLGDLSSAWKSCSSNNSDSTSVT